MSFYRRKFIEVHKVGRQGTYKQILEPLIFFRIGPFSYLNCKFLTKRYPVISRWNCPTDWALPKIPERLLDTFHAESMLASQLSRLHDNIEADHALSIDDKLDLRHGRHMTSLGLYSSQIRLLLFFHLIKSLIKYSTLCSAQIKDQSQLSLLKFTPLNLSHRIGVTISLNETRCPLKNFIPKTNVLKCHNNVGSGGSIRSISSWLYHSLLL